MRLLRAKFCKLYLLLILLTTILATKAENGRWNAISTVGIAEGLAGESVYQMMTDHAGRIWIASANGVSMFNGRSLSTYRLTSEMNRIVTVTDICETREKTLYAATDAGIYRLKLGDEQFERILPEVQHPECLLAVGDTLYIGGRQGLQVYDGKKLTTTNISVGRQGIDNIVRHYVQDAHGHIWFFGRYDLYRYYPESGQFKAQGIHQLLPEKATPSQFALVGDICYVGTKADGLYAVNLKNRKVSCVVGVGHVVTSVRSTNDGQVCVATNGAGAYLIDGAKMTVKTFYSSDAPAERRLPTNAVNCYYRDSQGVDWFGLMRYGMAYAWHHDALFEPWGCDGFSSVDTHVRCFLMHGDDTVIGTQNGFYFLCPGEVHYFPPEILGGSHIVNNVVWYRGEYYLGAFDGGLYVFNPNTLQLRQLAFVPSLRKSGIGTVVEGPDGLLWVGTSDGLFVIDNQRLHRWFTEQNSRIKGGMIISVTFDRTGNGWLTGATGLSMYSANSGEIVDVDYPDGFFQDVPWCRGFLGHDGKIFMRNGPQIFYTDEQMKDFGELQLPITLPDIWCREFLDDGKGHYWIASEMGLFRVNYQAEGMLRIGESEGLLGQHINELRQDVGGNVWVGTSKGLYRMDAGRLDAWQTRNIFHMHLYHIRRSDELLSKGEEQLVNEQHRIKLLWNISTETLQMETVLLDYARQTGRFYEYRLNEGAWNVIKDGEPFSLRNLPLGKHKLSVRLMGANGTVSEYVISVVPSAAAILEFALLLIFLTLLFMWFRYRKNTKVLLSERDEIEDALVESEELRVKGEESSEKYQKVKVDEQECADIVKRMKKYLERERVYTDQDLKMKDLADVLHLSAPKLSQVFNLYLGQNYYDFINSYRLEEFKRLIEAGEHKRFTITALSEQCGFKKSSFFSTFRKVEGMTPAEYLKKLGIKV